MASGVTPRAPGGGVGVIMAALGLLVTSMTTTLTPASGLLPATSRRGPAHHPGPGPRAPPFRNLRLDPDELRLSWDHVTSGPRAACAKDGQSRVLAAAGADHCTFRSLSACHVTNLSVFLRDDPGAAAWILYPESDPARPAAATDLRCRVHDVVRMTCRWGRGPGAPPDVQYRMFYRPARGPDPARPDGRLQRVGGGARALGHAQSVPDGVRVRPADQQEFELRAPGGVDLREPLPGPEPGRRLLPRPRQGPGRRRGGRQRLEPRGLSGLQATPPGSGDGADGRPGGPGGGAGAADVAAAAGTEAADPDAVPARPAREGRGRPGGGARGAGALARGPRGL